MKLSEAIQRIEFETIQVDGGKKYLPLIRCLEKVFPAVESRTFPLAFCCPLFNTGRKIVTQLMPAGHLPSEPGIYFICDVIDMLAYGHNIPKEQIADFVAAIEREFDMAGLDEEGRQSKIRRRA